MSTHNHQDDPEALAKSQAARYELRDSDLKTVTRHLVGFLVFAAICGPLAMGLMFAINNLMVHRPYALDATRMEPTRPGSSLAPLQTNITAHSDIEKVRQHEQEQSTTYGESSANPGMKRIPIDRAIDELGKEGVKGVTGGVH